LNQIKSEIAKQITSREKEMKELDAKGKTISDAIDYLKLEGINKNICPVCGKKTSNLLSHLKEEWDKKYKEQMGKARNEIKKLKKDLNNVETLLEQLKELNKDVKDAKDKLTDVNRKISEYLKRKITARDDPEALLNKRLGEVEAEDKKLSHSVKSQQEKLDNIQEKVRQIEQILEILNLEEKKKIVETIIQTPEYKGIEELKDKMAELLDMVNKITKAINEVSFKEAENKINSAGKMISELFCRITDNPAVSEIKLSVSIDKRTDRNNYEFKDQDGNDLTPILSQGDLNALALSIFLGLSSLNT